MTSHFLLVLFPNVFPPYQHAGVKGRDIMSNLTIFSNFVHSSVANNIQVDTVYTDQTKAFDRVSHKIFISKMHMYNIPLILIKWYKNFLAERVINCKINNILSTSFILNCGIPQGSSSSSSLWNIYINDLPDYILNSNILMYADDVKLFKHITCEDDVSLLQAELSNFYNWCQMNNLILNEMKSVYISYFNINMKFNNVLPSLYYINDVNL